MALNITRGLVWKPQKVVIYGPEGIGKSTFASKFPDPVFIDTEGSTNLLDVARLPRSTSWTMLLNMIKEVKATPGCCKTLIIDTMDWAEQLCVAHICAIYDKKSVEDFGYGKGYVLVKEEIGRLLNLLTDVIDAGINVVLTAHSQIRKFELPDECGSFDRYELKLGNKTGGQTSALVKEWADMVLFANYKQRVVEINDKKKAQGGSRIMHTQHHPCWDAKNRHGLKPEIPFDYEHIAFCIPNQTDEDLKQAVNPVPPSTQETKVADPPPQVAPAGQASQDPPKDVKPETPPAEKTDDKEVAAMDGMLVCQQEKTEHQKRVDKDLQGLPKSLVDLMTANNVNASEIQRVVSMKGYYPADTPIKNYDTGFIEGVLVGAWDQVHAMITESPFK